MTLKKFISFFLSLLIFINGLTVFAAPSEVKKNEDLKISCTVNGNITMLNFTPQEFTKNISKITVDSINVLEKFGTKSVDYAQKLAYYLDEKSNTVYIKTLKDRHTLSFEMKNGETFHFIFKNGVFKKIDTAHPPLKELHIKLDGYFEGALVGQRKYDAVSGATGSASANKNSNIKIMVCETEKNQSPKKSDWIELHRSEVEVDKGKTKILLDENSGMKPSYNANSSAITLSGTPNKEGVYPVKVELFDVYGRKATSNTVYFSVSDINHTYLDEIMKDVNTKLKTTKNGKVIFNQEPWYIAYFNKNKSGERQTYILPNNINLWQGSHESGVYGQLGLIIPVKDRPDKSKNEYYPWEDRQPIQDFILNEGSRLTLVNMKVFSGVNIIVNKGAILNVHDSSIYGKITVNDGGVLRINYDPDKKIADDFGKLRSKALSASSIQGQIILNDGAVLEDSYIYSNTNNLTDSGAALQNIRPLVLVKGNAFIKGNVFVRGDESPTGTDRKTKMPYRGQNAMTIDGGSLTIDKNASLYLYGGGTKATTSLGGNALELKNGKVLGEGSLIALGGSGHSSLFGYAVTGNGDISVERAYLKIGKGENPNNKKAISEEVNIRNNVKGQVVNSNSSSEYGEYWSYSSAPKQLSKEFIGNTLINSQGQEKIEGKEVPKDLEKKPNKKIKRVDFAPNQFDNRSISLVNNEDGKNWLKGVLSSSAQVKVNNENIPCLKNENQKCFWAERNAFYVYGLNIGDIVTVNLEGYIPVKLKAISVDGFIKYRLEPDSSSSDDELPYTPSEDYDLSDENIEKSRTILKEILKNLDLGKLDLAGINTKRNSGTINEFKNILKKARDIADKNTLSLDEKKELLDLTRIKDDQYEGFEKYTKNIPIDLKVNNQRKVKNKHDSSKLHPLLENGQVSYSSELRNLSKDSYPKLELFYITEDEYNTKLDSQTGATPKFEKNILDKKYFDLKSEDQDYIIKVNEDEVLKDIPGVKLLKVVFKVKLCDKVYITGSDFVFLNKKEDKKDKEDEKISEKDRTIIVEKDPIFEEFKNETEKILEKEGYYEYKTKYKKQLKESQKRQPASYISGYPDGTFKPNAKVSRAEAATMVYNFLNKADSHKVQYFKDAKASWYKDSLSYAKTNDMLLSKNGNIRPDENITRGEFVRMVMPLLKDKKTSAPFVDIKGTEFEKAINIAYENNIICGYPDNTFRPEMTITRAEAVAILNRLFNLKLDKNISYSNLKEFSDVKKNHWAYFEILIATNVTSINSQKESFQSFEEVPYREKVWVEKNHYVEKNKKYNFYEQTLNVNNLEIKGKFEEKAKLNFENKISFKENKREIRIPETIHKNIKNLYKDYEILNSFVLNLNKRHEGKIQVKLNFDKNLNDKNLKIYILRNGSLKSLEAKVLNSKLNLQIDQLGSFVILCEKNKEESPQEKALKEKLSQLNSLIEKAEKSLKDPKFTEDSKKELKSILEDLKYLDRKDLNKVQRAMEDIEKAMGALLEKPIVKPVRVILFLKEVDPSPHAKPNKDASVILHGNFGDIFAQLKNESGEIYDIKDPSMDNKIFKYWKIKDKTFSSQDLNKSKITEDMADGDLITISPIFENKIENNKKVIFSKPSFNTPSHSIGIDKKDSDSKVWIEKINNNEGKLTLLPNTSLKRAKHDAEQGFMIIDSSYLQINKLLVNSYIKVEVEGFNDVYLKVEQSMFSYKLSPIEKNQVPQDNF